MSQNSMTPIRFKPMAPINRRRTVERNDDGDTLETATPLASMPPTKRPLVFTDPDGMVKPTTPHVASEPPNGLVVACVILIAMFFIFCIFIVHFNALHQN